MLSRRALVLKEEHEMEPVVTAMVTLGMVMIVLLVPYLFFDSESMILDETARTALPGRFVKLSDGITHYEWKDRDNGLVVVLVHGFSAPHFVWDHTWPALVDAGFRVLKYDLYGRGYSDRRRADYNENLFDRQLLELLSALDVDPPIDLVGLSMGGYCGHFCGRAFRTGEKTCPD